MDAGEKLGALIIDIDFAGEEIVNVYQLLQDGLEKQQDLAMKIAIGLIRSQ